MTMWWWMIFAIAGIALLGHWRTKSAVWGTATMGLVIGLIVAAIHPGFDWAFVGKIVAIATLIGVVIEWLPRLGRKSAQ
ncbi:MAG: hypothetical protein ABI538_06635 [Pseudoxanthomonas sp.]